MMTNFEPTDCEIRLASNESEFQQIHRLNYKAFVEEIPQHPPNSERRLVDQFHDENTYVVGKMGNEVIAMLAVRAERPFSLDAKVEHLDTLLVPGRSYCEIRLLYVVPAYRRRNLLARLLRGGMHYACEMGCDAALISGTLRQQRLYKHIGFQAFGPPVGNEPAMFQPMLLLKESVNLPQG